MKMKHNKKRNTAFLYECLVKELTKSIVRNDKDKKKAIIKIIKEFYCRGSLLREDLEIYKSVLESNKMSTEFAKRFIFEAKKDYDALDRKAIFNLQTKLIRAINETLSNNAFANFISNYKDIASVGAFFDSNLKAKNRLIVESRLLTKLTKKPSAEKEMRHIDNLTYKTFVDSFNKRYEKTLRKEQKDLLTNYIVSFSDNGLGLKSFMNEEISRLIKEVDNITETQKNDKNGMFLSKIERVSTKLKDFSKKPICEQMVKDVFYIQDLVAEINRNA